MQNRTAKYVFLTILASSCSQQATEITTKKSHPITPNGSMSTEQVLQEIDRFDELRDAEHHQRALRHSPGRIPESSRLPVPTAAEAYVARRMVQTLRSKLRRLPRKITLTSRARVTGSSRNRVEAEIDVVGCCTPSVKRDILAVAAQLPTMEVWMPAKIRFRPAPDYSEYPGQHIVKNQSKVTAAYLVDSNGVTELSRR